MPRIVVYNTAIWAIPAASCPITEKLVSRTHSTYKGNNPESFSHEYRVVPPGVSCIVYPFVEGRFVPDLRLVCMHHTSPVPCDRALTCRVSDSVFVPIDLLNAQRGMREAIRTIWFPEKRSIMPER